MMYHTYGQHHSAVSASAYPRTAYYPFVVLFFNCLLTFGSYFCLDIPSVLQDQFQGNLTCGNGSSHTNGSGGCVEGLGMTPEQYNLLYAIYAWTLFELNDLRLLRDLSLTALSLAPFTLTDY